MYIDVDKIKSKMTSIKDSVLNRTPDFVTNTKNYLIDHGPEIVTAVAAITVAGFVRKQYYLVEGAYFDDQRRRADIAGVIGWLRREGHDFEYYPGLGVWSDFDGEESKTHDSQ